MPNWLNGDVSNRRVQDYVYSVAVSHDGQWVVSASQDRGVHFWDAKSGIVQLTLQGHTDAGPLSPRSIRAPWTEISSVLVYSADLSPTGGLLATCSNDYRVRICKFRYSPESPLALIQVADSFCFREIHCHFLTAVDPVYNLSFLLSFSFHF